MAIERWYKKVTIQRATKTTDSAGKTSTVWATHLITTGLLAEPSQAKQSSIAQQYQVLQPYYFYTAPCQDIKQDDRILFGSKYYRIVSNPRDTAGRGHHLVFVCEALDGEV